MEQQSLTEITENTHFNQFAAILSVAMSPKWRMAHPEVPDVRSTLDRLVRLNRSLLKDAINIRDAFIKEWSMLLSSIAEADPKLFYTPDDLTWFFMLLDGDASEARMIISMLFAWSTTRREFVTIEQVVEISGKTASTWRQRIERDEVIGAFKAGKTWMIPVLSLRAYGHKVPTSLHIEEVTKEEQGN